MRNTETCAYFKMNKLVIGYDFLDSKNFKEMCVTLINERIKITKNNAQIHS